MRTRRVPVFAAAVLAFALACSNACAATITEYTSALSSSPQEAVRGPDGNVWFTEPGNGGAIGRITPAGAISQFRVGLSSTPLAIALGPDGNLWFTEPSAQKIGKITTSGTITEYGLASGSPQGIAAGPDGNLWFTDTGSPAAIGKITTSGAVTRYTAGLTSTAPYRITAGPDGAMWFTNHNSNPAAPAVGRITTSGTITEYSGATGLPTSIINGPDGNLWFTEGNNPGAIARITTAGTITEFSTGLTANQSPTGLVLGPDGRLYFTEKTGNSALGAITMSGTITEYTAGLSASSGPTGIAAGADGNLWFMESGTTARIGRLTAPPAATTGSAAAITNDAATLAGSVTPNTETTSYRFDYGTTTSYGSQTSSSTTTASAGTAQSVSAPVSGLSSSTTYHFRVVATNASGTTYGVDQSFTTTSVPAPGAYTAAATGIGQTAATLVGTVNPNGRATTYHFEWGPTTSYGSQGPVPDASVTTDSSDHSVSLTLPALTASTTYHYRVVATNTSGTTYGADQSFTTASPPPSGPTPASTGTAAGDTPAAASDLGAKTPATPAADPSPRAADPPLASAPTNGLPPAGSPAAGKSVSIQPASGSVTVRLPGTTRDVPLADAGSSVPVGSVIDATAGQVTLTAALDSAGHVQTGTFWGGRFTVTQGHGPLTTVRLAHPKVACATTRAAAAIASKGKPRGKDVLGKVWGRDDHGHFKTIGAYASATVHGTEWLTEDRCDGTLVRVAKGAVSVTDNRTHRSVLVRAGHEYLVPAR